MICNIQPPFQTHHTSCPHNTHVCCTVTNMHQLKYNKYCTIRHATCYVDCGWNVMAHAQKPDFVLRRNGRVHLNRRGHQFSRLLAGELYTSACRVCTARASLCSAVMWRLLVTHSLLLFTQNPQTNNIRLYNFTLWHSDSTTQCYTTTHSCFIFNKMITYSKYKKAIIRFYRMRIQEAAYMYN